MLFIQFVTTIVLVGVVGAQKSCSQGQCGSGYCRTYGKLARCECGTGWMGIHCQRPCQDIYKSCKRWDEEHRCQWAKGSTLWFDDNCAATCKSCQVDKNNKLPIAFPPLLEPLDWLVGHWETESQSNYRYPLKTFGAYKEKLIIQQSNVTMFDRPSLNYTAIAQTIGDSTDLHWDVGFITSKLIIEDTGFKNEDKAVKDEIGIELNSNTGINTIEEGELKGQEIALNTTWKKALPHMENKLFKSAKRTFRALGSGQLEESGEMVSAGGQTITWTKYFTRVKNLLQPE